MAKWSSEVNSVHNIVKSESDPYEYRGLVLKNELKVLVVSDPAADKAAAALSVQVGYMSDPRNIPGLAHFCEHMLFLGTRKYPKENHYHQFLSLHGGKANAFTSTDNTCFYFDVSAHMFKEATDIFAQFFLEPLFDKDSTDRELNAVDNENEKNIKQDRRRLLRLERATSSSEHDFSKFSTGNRETLYTIPNRDGIDVRQALLDFHEKWYSSNIMNLCLFGKESLDELSDMAVELFSGIQNKNVTAPEWVNHPLTERELRVQLKVVPVKDIRQMLLTFPVPDIRKYFRTNPSKYVSRLVVHEGEGSLYSYLKQAGWATAINGGLRPGARGFCFFRIYIDLSTDGLDHTDEIATAVFQYLNLLRQQGPQLWLFNEMRNLGNMQFRFKSKESPSKYVSALTGRMEDYEWNDILRADYVVNEYRPDIITEMLSYLEPDRVRVVLLSKSFEPEVNLREAYFSIDYALEEIPLEKINTWMNAEPPPELQLPPPNEFIPMNFSLADEDARYTRVPVLITDEPHYRIWFMQDKEYNLPKNIASFELRSPVVYQDPLNCCLSHLALQCFKDANKEYFYSAELAGCAYYLSRNVDGLKLELRGFNDHQQMILERILERLSTFRIDTKRFEILKDAYIRKLRSFTAEQPYEHAVFYLHLSLSEKCFTHEELLQAVESEAGTPERCEALLQEILCKVYVEALIHGNMSVDEAHRMGETVRSVLSTGQCWTYDETRNMRDHRLNDGETYQLYRSNDVHTTNAVYVYYQVGSIYSEDIRVQATNDLFCQIIEEPTYKVLRTEQQLGYLVSGGRKETYGSYGIRILVQSLKRASLVAERIEAFVNDFMLKRLQEMSIGEFNNYKTARIVRLLERPKNLDELHECLLKEISQRTYMFTRKEQKAEMIRKLSKEDVVTFYKRYISRSARELRQIVVNVESSVRFAQEASNIEFFRRAHPFLEGNKPYPTLAVQTDASPAPAAVAAPDEGLPLGSFAPSQSARSPTVCAVEKLIMTNLFL